MCYAPAKRTRHLIDRAKKCIESGNLAGAGRLLESAREVMGPAVNVQWEGRRIGDWYREAQQQLLYALRSE